MKTRELLIIVLLGFLKLSLYGQFAGGSGTVEDPYQIQTLEQLQTIGSSLNYLASHFIQISDIDASETINWNDGLGFEPIGGGDYFFKGSYDGSSYKISNLYINRYEYVGLFGFVDSAVINNIALEEFKYYCNDWVGGLIGYVLSGSVNDSYAIGIIQSQASYKGGLVGLNQNGIITNCYAQVVLNNGGYTGMGGLIGVNHGIVVNSFAESQLQGGEYYVGGFIGYNSGTVENSYANSELIATHGEGFGGLIGMNDGGTILNSFSLSALSLLSVELVEKVGGLVGINGDVAGNASIINCYAQGNVSGRNEIGGLVGYGSPISFISQSYSTGFVTGMSDVGGFIGKNYSSTIQSSYWDTITSGHSNGSGTEISDGITGLSTSQMTCSSAPNYMTQFNFDTLWALTAGYPALFWQDVEPYEPSVPDSPSLLFPANGSVYLPALLSFSWVAPSCSNTFRLQIATSENFEEPVLDSIGFESPTLPVSGLPFGSTFYWRVNATNDVGTGEWSEIWSFSTIPHFTFAIVSGYSYCFGEQIEIEVAVNADYNEGNSFVIQLSDISGNFENPIILAEIDTTTSFNVIVSVPDTLTFGAPYLIRILSTQPEVYSDPESIVINQIPSSTFTISADKLCWDKSVIVTYTGNATASATCQWNFDDGIILSGSGFGPYEIKWATAGLKTIGLIVEENECSSNSSLNLVVAPQTQPNPICMVTVNEANKNLIIWEQPLAHPYDSIVIYRESSQSNVYVPIGIQSALELTSFIDNGSNPTQNANRYKLAVIDTCGYESTLSSYHKTIHLTISQGINGALNLIWDEYVGFSYNSFHVYRGTSAGELAEIAVLPSNIFSYTDLTPPGNTVFYEIVIFNPDPCDIGNSKSLPLSFSSVCSNIVNSTQVSVPEIESDMIEIWPNPVGDLLNIRFEYVNVPVTVHLTSIDGRMLKEIKVGTGISQIDLKNYSKGVYVLKIMIGDIKFYHKIIKE